MAIHRVRCMASVVLVSVLAVGCGSSTGLPTDNNESTAIQRDGVAATAPVEPPCFTGVYIAGDGPTYTSVDELAEASDAIVTGRVTAQSCALSAPDPDEGGEEPAVYRLISEVTVEQSLTDAISPGDVVTVGQPPGGSSPDFTALETGEEVLLFLYEVDDPAVGAQWWPLNLSNAIADIDPANGALTWRSELLQGPPATLEQLITSLTH